MINIQSAITGQGRLTPASQARAVSEFPHIVLAIAHNHLIITTRRGVGGQSVVLCEDRVRETKTSMLSEDFEILRSIAALFVPVLSSFPSEPKFDVLNRAQAQVRVRFAMRGAF